MREGAMKLTKPASVDVAELRRVAFRTAGSDASDLLLDAASEIEDLRASVIAFGGPGAVEYAKNCGLSHNTLSAHHYDILARAGARMVAFKRSDDET